MNRPLASSRRFNRHNGLLVNGRSVKASIVATAALAVLAGCSSTDSSMFSSDKIDYHSAAAKTKPLEVPPDLATMSQEGRYQPQTTSSTVSASTYQGPTAPAAEPATPAVAPQAVSNARIERDGSQRWLATSLTPDQIWPQLRAFWQERGFNLAVDQPETGVMETEWAENHAKLPQDWIRRSIGKVLSDLYSTGERDKFRTRVERTATGSEVYISHRGMEEVMIKQGTETTKWQPRPTDPQLEAEFLSRLMVKLSPRDQIAKAEASTVAAPTTPARARVVDGSPTQLRLDEGFSQAWRRVGLALDRSGFTVEDRDRSNGLYFVRYVDPKLAGQEEPGFFKRLFSSSDKKAAEALSRYRISVKGEGNATTVAVLNGQGTPETGEVGQRIVSVLLNELR